MDDFLYVCFDSPQIKLYDRFKSFCLDSRAVTRLDVWSQMILIELFRWLMAVDDERMQQSNSEKKSKTNVCSNAVRNLDVFPIQNKCTQTVSR